MTIRSTHHGLSVHTGADTDAGADTADNRRLHRPVPKTVPLSNTFNDATSGHLYPQRAGHEGLDFYTGPTDVEAMYGGVVVRVVNTWIPKVNEGLGLGNLVTILSCTDSATGTGFEHTYAHLQEDSKMPEAAPGLVQEKGIVVTAGMTVQKGQKLGTSGGSGTYEKEPTPDDPEATTRPINHLHVHLQAFDIDGVVTSEYVPAKQDNPWDNKNKRYKHKVTLEAERIGGCMNYACFLPPDGALPDLDQYSRRLLSPRDSNPDIPVYITIFTATSTPDDRTLLTATARAVESNRRGTIAGNQLGCYAVLEEYPSTNPTWYKIQYRDTQTGWVSKTGMATGANVVWVQVEAATATMPKAPANPHFVTTNGTPNVRALPSTTARSQATLTAGKCYAVLGTFWDTSPNVRETARRWWRIQYGKAGNGAPLKGWVREDVVWKYKDATGVPLYGGAPDGLVAPSIQSQAPPASPTGSAPTPQPQPMLEVLASVGLNFRETPEITGTKIKTDPLPIGTTAKILYYNGKTKESGGRWWKIKLLGDDGQEGWVAHGPASTPYVQVTNADSVDIYLPNSSQRGGGQGGGGLGYPLDGQQDPPAGGLYARQGLAAGGNVLRRWPAAAAPALATGVQAEVWYTVRRLFARTGLGDLWLEVVPHSAIPSGTASGAAGWVPASRMVLAAQGTPVLPPSARFVRLRAWVTAGANVRSGPDTAYTPVLRTLTDRSAWYRLEGQNATPATWYRLEYASGSYGWVYAGLLDVIEPVRIPLTALPLQQASSSPAAEPAATGTAATGTTSTAGYAQGDFRNLATNPDGRWSVSKTGRTAALSFDCPRSPVQYYARQNPQPQFVLPAAFRPTSTVTQTVTGTEVDAHRVDLAGAPAVTFTVRIETDGEVRYVDNSQVDHVGFVRYGVRALAYRTATTLVEPVDPTPPGDLSDSGTYHNRQVNWGSAWELERAGNAVSGTFTTTRSPAEYYANQNREALLWLPPAYWPDADARFRVTGAVRVNADGTDSPDARRVNFWITVRRSDGRMYYDRDTALEDAGVGYVRYTVNVAWTAVPRLTVPTAPRQLEVDDIEAEEVELDWRSPSDNGGASIDEYRVEEYRHGRWRTAEDEITRTRYDVEDRDPYTRYSFRVRAHNSVGWSEPTTALTVTTLREAPGTPGRPTATATHAQVALSWTVPSSGGAVTGYRVQRRVGSGSWQTQVADTGETSPGWTDAAVSAATAYSYRVAAYNYGEPGAWSSTHSVTTAATPTLPGQVTALAVAPGTTRRLALSWTAPSDTGGGVTGYQVERAPDAEPRAWATLVADTGSATPSWGDDAVAADTVVHYRVSACNSAGVGTASAAAMGHSRPQLRLQRQALYPLAAHSEPRPDAPVTASFTAYQPGQTYELAGQVPGPAGWWQLQLLDPAAPGAAWLPTGTGTARGSTTALPAPPAAPASFTATLASGEVTLTWTAPSTGATVTGYRLWRQTDAGTFTQLGTDLAATVLTQTDSTVSNGHVYRYWLQGLSDAGPGVPSPTVALAAPDAVTALTAMATTTTLALSWTQATTGGLPTGFRVAWRESGTDDFYWEVGVTGTTHTVTDLIPGTAYELRVTAFNQAGAAAVTTGTGTTVQVAPGDPTALTVTVASNTATVSWTAPAAGPTAGGRPDAYHLQSKTPATAAWAATYTTVTAATHTLSDLAYETGYEVQVRAANTAGQSAWVGTPFTSGRARPSAVQELTAAPSDASQLQLSWQTPLATAGGISGYRIERSADVEPRVWVEQVADTGTPATIWADSGLSADTVVHYRVTGRNAEGLGASTTAQGRTRPRLALLATATYPLSAHAWPLATAPTTHTWTAHDATVALDVRGQAPGWWLGKGIRTTVQ